MFSDRNSISFYLHLRFQLHSFFLRKLYLFVFPWASVITFSSEFFFFALSSITWFTLSFLFHLGWLGFLVYFRFVFVALSSISTSFSLSLLYSLSGSLSSSRSSCSLSLRLLFFLSSFCHLAWAGFFRYVLVFGYCDASISSIMISLSGWPFLKYVFMLFWWICLTFARFWPAFLIR